MINLNCKKGHLTGRYINNRACVGCVREVSLKQIADPVKKKKRWQASSNFNWKKAGIINPDGSYFRCTDYDRCYQIQQGSCGICKKHQTEFKKVLAVDHDHTTGIVRGLLCELCNHLLGCAKDNKDILGQAILYLNLH